MLKRNKQNKSGFTLVEILVVIVILAIIASIALPKISGHTKRAKESKMASDLKTLRDAVDAFYADTGYYPAKLQDLIIDTAPSQARDNNGNLVNLNAKDWNGPYLENLPIDPFSGKYYAYKISGGQVGRVQSSATQIGTNGTAYYRW